MLLLRSCLKAGALFAVWLLAIDPAAARLQSILVPQVGLRGTDVAVIVNEADPLSVEIGAYYARRRAVPPEQIIRVRFEAGGAVMPPADFRRVKGEVDRGTPEHVQAYVLTWTGPYRVGCMSITTAFAAGFDQAYCARGCKATRPSDYHASRSLAPYSDHGMRPAVILAAADMDQARALVERGIAADESWPEGSGVLMRTSDKSRTVRQARWALARMIAAPVLALDIIDADEVRDRDDLLFYFTGLKRVPDIDRNRYLPGAVADHLTSLGGQLAGGGQMSALRWLEAGATGSYGTVVEPCNILGKFPDVPALLASYLGGETLVEAYWKSVRMPGQGVFVGEPLARPWGGWRLSGDETGTPRLEGFVLGGRRWVLLGADGPIGPYRPLTEPVALAPGHHGLPLPADAPPYLWLRPVGASPPRWELLSP